jgi:hypothetical protein
MVSLFYRKLGALAKPLEGFLGRDRPHHLRHLLASVGELAALKGTSINSALLRIEPRY